MPEQLSIPGLDATALPFRPDVISPQQRGKLLGYTLFLAIFPQLVAAHRIAQRAADLRSQHGLAGTLLPPGRLHLTLQTIANFIDTTPQSVVDAAKAASLSVVCPPLPIVFDHVMTFPASGAFVLRCDARSDAAVARLRQSLARALRRVGLQPEPSRTPHMTMLYDPHHIARQPIEPVCWTASRFALILSHVGTGHHQWIDQWDLVD